MALPNEPITRQEMYLSNIAGQNTTLPDAPITREEMYLDYIAKTGGTGEGDMKKSVYDSDNSVASAGGIKMFVNQKIGTIPQRVGSLETTAGVLQGEVTSIENTLGNLGTASTKNSTSVVTESTDLVESGAVYDALGFGNKNIGQWINKNLGGDATAGYKLDNGGSSLIAKVKQNTSFTVSRKHGQGNRFRIVGFVNEPSSVASLSSEQLYSNNSADTYTVNSGNYNYLVFTYDSTTTISQDEAEAMIELGDTKTAYEPYHASVEQTLRDAEVIEGKNLIPMPYLNSAYCPSTVGSTYINNGVTFTCQDNYSIRVNGTLTSSAAQIALTGRADGDTTLKLKKGKYKVKDITSVATTIGGTYTAIPIVNGAFEVTDAHIISGKDYAAIGLYSAVGTATGQSINTVLYPMVYAPSETDTYEPYYIPLKDVVPNKCDNSVIAPVENGATASKAYAVGEHFIRDGAFCTCKQAISQGGSFTLNTNYTAGDVAGCLIKQATFSGTTNASGNLSITTDLTRVVLGIELDNDKTALNYKTSSYIGIHIMNASNLEAYASQSVSGTYYYID